MRDEKQEEEEEELRECTPEENAPYGPMQNSTRFGEHPPFAAGFRALPLRTSKKLHDALEEYCGQLHQPHHHEVP